jgi:low affinity Fe/Cu permease
VKEQGQKRLTDTELDYKNQILFQQEESEEIQGQLNEEIHALSEQLTQAVTIRDNQISLLTQQLEAIDKQLHEKVEALDKLQESHSLKLDQQYE